MNKRQMQSLIMKVKGGVYRTRRVPIELENLGCHITQTELEEDQ